MREYGKPAAWASRQKWGRRKAALQHYVSALIVVVLAAGVSWYLLSSNWEWFGKEYRLAAVVAVVLGSAWYAWLQHQDGARAWEKAGAAAIGVSSEKLTRKAARAAKPVAAMYGMVLGKRQGDVDLILFGRRGTLLCVEIKTGFGPVSLYGNRVRAGKSLIHGDPLGQAARCSDRLSRLLEGAPVTPVLCVARMTNAAFTTDSGITVCSPKDLSRVLREGEVAYRSEGEIEDAIDAILAANKKWGDG